MKTLLPTSTAGSLPKPSWLAQPEVLWYLGSTLFVIGIWFIEVKLFKIKEIPIYSDIKFLYLNLRK